MEHPPQTELFRDGFYLTYPHYNGFCRDGHQMVLGRLDGATASLWRSSMVEKEDLSLCAFDVSREVEKMLWFDVARQADRLVIVVQQGLWIYDVVTGRGECIYRAQAPAQLMSFPSISADGCNVVVGLVFPDKWAALLVEVDSGRSRILFEHPWYMNHFHFSPHDESWIGYCHEGLCHTVPDRVWGWHPEHAPLGRCLFDQHWGDPARELWVGHERWSFHETSAVVVAYGGSPGELRGVYELSVDGTSRLIAGGDRYLHTNISSSGHFVVVDTSGPHDEHGRGWENARNISDILLLRAATGEQRWLARSMLDLHPYHPHPVFSPDESFVYFNEATHPVRGNSVRRVRNPWVSGDSNHAART